MTTYYKAFNKRQGIVLTPEGQMFSEAGNLTLLAAGALFASKAEAEQTASRIVSPKFKVEEVTI